MQHNEKDQENGTSCKPRSVFRDLEILRRENRGTDLIDDAENQIVASITYERTFTKRTPGVSSPHIEVGLLISPSEPRRSLCESARPVHCKAVPVSLNIVLKLLD